MLPILQKIDDYLATKKNLWSPNTLQSAKGRLRTCVLFSDTLDPQVIFDELKKGGYNLYSIKTYLIVASGFENFLTKADRIAQFRRENAFVFRNAYQDKQRSMSQQEFEAILQSAPTPGAHNLLMLLGQCGLRRSEALEANWSDFDPARNLLTVTGKGGRTRYVPLNADWLRPTPGALKITGPEGSGHRYFIKRTGFTFIDFRAYFATRIANHPELNIRDAQVLLGHSSVNTTQRYVRVDQNKLHRVLLMKG